MMKLNKQELIIQQKMRGFEPELDTNDFWESLSDHVPKKKKRKGWFYVVLLGLLTLISIVSLLVIDAGSIKTKGSEQISKVNSTVITNGETIKNDEPQYIDNKNKQTKSNSPNTMNSSVLNNLNKIEKNTKTHAINNLKYKQNSVVDQKLKLNKDEKIINSSIVKFNTINTNSNTILINPILSIIPKLLPIVHVRKGVPTPAITIIPKTVNANYFTWSIGTSLGYFDHEFEPNNEYSKLNTSLISAESKPVLGLHIGFTYNFLNKYYINSGIQYNQIVTKIHPKWDLTQSEENLNPNGLTERLTRQFRYEAVGHNYQNLIDIPINIGLKLYESNKFNLSFETGAVLNLITYSKGIFIDDKYKLHYYKNNSENPYGNFKLGFQTSILIEYRLKNNMNIYFQPNASFRTVSYKFSNLDIKEKYRIYNLKVGLRYRL